MKKLENAYHDAVPIDSEYRKEQMQPLNNILGYIRTASHRYGSDKQRALMAPLLDTIVAKSCTWDRYQCARCFEALLREYVGEWLELLLAVAGYTEEYSKISSASRRRDKYADSHLEEYGVVNNKTWVKREENALLKMTTAMEDSYNTDHERLLRVIANAIGAEDLNELGLSELTCFIISQQKGHIAYGEAPYGVKEKQNLPLKQCNLLGRDEILDRITENFNSGNNAQILYGMGGVGKTEIALNYAYLHRSDYKAIAWINAGSLTEINKSCREFLLKATPGAVPVLEDELRAAFVSYFETSTDWLIVFDNADYLDSQNGNMRDVLKSYIPNSNGHVLITTRCNADFLRAVRTQVDAFQPEIAVQFLEEHTEQPPDADAEFLAKKLGYLPLALQYAASYIREHTTYKGYLDRWDKHGMAIFDDKSGDYAKQTVRAAFHITLDNLKENRLAMDMLHRLACLEVAYLPVEAYLKAVSDQQDAPFCSDDIAEMLPDSDWEPLHTALNDELARESLIRTLSKYSLIRWDKSCIRMHPLLRAIIFSDMTESERTQWFDSFETPLLLMRMFGDYNAEDEENIGRAGYTAIINGMERLWNYIDNDPLYDEAVMNSWWETIYKIRKKRIALYYRVAKLAAYTENDEIMQEALDLHEALEVKYGRLDTKYGM